LNPLSGGRVSIPYMACGFQFIALAIAFRYVLNRKQFSAPKTI
jgi:alkylation response protein AidB-like acyl-CoA dehydrogenase